MQKVIIIGGVGNGTVIAQAIKDSNIRGCNELSVEGYFSDRIAPGDIIEGLPVIAKTNKENIRLYTDKGYKFIFTVYRIDGQEERLSLFEDLELTNKNLATFIHPTAYVAPDVTIEGGVVIMPYVMISSNARIGKGSLIMTGATVGHNTLIGMYNHIASQAVVGGYIKSDIGVHFGLNCTVREHLTIGKNSTVGMGAVLTKNVSEKEIWVGNPAKLLRIAK
jgi:sugar O-acyltransferase (sialic acid O-acetyltransferase NeuD family)